VPAAALLAGHLVGTSHSAVEGSHATRRLAIAIAIVGAAWVGVALYFAAVDRFADFWGAVIGFNQLYAGNPVNNLLDGVVFDRLVPPALYFALPLTAATVLGLTAGTMVARWRTMLVTYAVGVACAVALPGYFLPHYYQLWLPVLCLGAALGLAALRPQLISPRTWWLRAGGSLTALLLVTQLPTLGEPSQEWSRRKFGERLVRSTALAEAVDALLLPGETFFEWGHEAELYYYSGRRPPGGEFRCEHLLRGPREPERSARLLADLRREQPELVLVSAVHPFPLEHAVPSWIIANYADADASTRALLKAGDYRVLLRRGGALERRLRFRAVTAAATP
jgi:hypothetical protein